MNIIMLRWRSQTQRTTYFIFPFVLNVQNKWGVIAYEYKISFTCDEGEGWWYDPFEVCNQLFVICEVASLELFY